jgi:hypothetical protein
MDQIFSTVNGPQASGSVSFIAYISTTSLGFVWLLWRHISTRTQRQLNDGLINTTQEMVFPDRSILTQFVENLTSSRLIGCVLSLTNTLCCTSMSFKSTFTRAKFMDCCKKFAFSGKVKVFPGDYSLWVLDGASIHCDKNMIAYLRSLGIILIFLPA